MWPSIVFISTAVRNSDSEIVVVYCDDLAEHVNTLWGRMWGC